MLVFWLLPHYLPISPSFTSAWSPKFVKLKLFLTAPTACTEMVVVKPKVIAEVPPPILLQLVTGFLSPRVGAAERAAIGLWAWHRHSMSPGEVRMRARGCCWHFLPWSLGSLRSNAVPFPEVIHLQKMLWVWTVLFGSVMETATGKTRWAFQWSDFQRKTVNIRIRICVYSHYLLKEPQNSFLIANLLYLCGPLNVSPTRCSEFWPMCE